jgi:enoyl-[acyl-carrier protein] reductase II
MSAFRTRMTDLLGIELPIMQAPLGPWTSPELTAAVSEAGGIGTLGTVLMPPERVAELVTRTQELTSRPFAVNFSARGPFDPEAFEATLAARPAAITFAHGDPGDLPLRAHEAGVSFVQMVNTVDAARRAAEQGVDAVIAQGSESAGFGGEVAALPLIPQVVDAVPELPVIASGGIADGRGLAAALVLGADGVNIGTRFLAATETPISDDWKRSIVEAASEDSVRAEFANGLVPKPDWDGAYEVAPRVLRTAFVDEWNGRPGDVPAAAERLRDEVMSAATSGRLHELLPFTGQTAGLVHEVLSVREILERMVEAARNALARSEPAR